MKRKDWRAAGLPGGDDADADRRQVEGADSARPDARTKRFGELKKSIGSVSQKVLTAQLRDMEEKGLVNRKVYAEVPPRVEYSLTDLGRSLKPILDAMWDWARATRRKTADLKRKRTWAELETLFRSFVFVQRMGSSRKICSTVKLTSDSLGTIRSATSPVSLLALQKICSSPSRCWRAPAGGRCP